MVKPILFNSDMVRAILEGRKTVTRRKIDIDMSNQFDVETDGSVICYIDPGTGDRYRPEELCRYQTGDILYVRETWQECCRNHVHNPIVHSKYCYKASLDSALYGCIEEGECKWHPSIHMPKEAARIWLRVVSVRLERLKDMTSEEAWKEGARCTCMYPVPDCAGNKAEFIKIWDSTIPKKAIPHYGWEANPWVWVIEFERCEKPED